MIKDALIVLVLRKFQGFGNRESGTVDEDQNIHEKCIWLPE